MAVTTVNVKATIHSQQGTPLNGADIVVALEHADINAGYVIKDAKAYVTDVDGQVTMPLWPNSLGVTESRYRIKCKHPSTDQLILDVMATVPHESGGEPITEIDLYTIAEQPAYEGKNEVAIATEVAVQAALDAQTHEAKGEKWAEEVEDVEVETGKYSAKHHAAKAEQWADSSQGVPTLSYGDLASPLLHLPLKNSLAMAMGVGSVTFTRSTTATYIDRYGVLQTAAIDTPRFEREGLLIEGESTNILLYSRDLSNGVWTGTAVTPVTDGTLGPDGVTQAWKVEDNSNTATQYLNNNVTTGGYVVGGHAGSFFLKAGTSSLCRVNFQVYGTTTCAEYAYINLTTGVSSNPAITTHKLANGWWWIKMPADNTDAANIYSRVLIYPATGAASMDATAMGSVYCIDAQIEALPFATSPVFTTSAPVTRTADHCSLTSVGNYQHYPVTYMCDFELFASPTDQSGTNSRIFSINGPGTEDFRTSVSSAWGWIASAEAGYVWLNSAEIVTNHRLAITIEDTDIKIYLDGVIKLSTTHSITKYGATEILLGEYATNVMYGHISNFRIFGNAISEPAMRVA